MSRPRVAIRLPVDAGRSQPFPVRFAGGESELTQYTLLHGHDQTLTLILRRLKCDRQQPCKTCVDRGLSLSCTFARGTPAGQEVRASSSVHDRINQLERLVTSLMGNKDSEEASPSRSVLSHLEDHNDESKPDMPGTPDRVKLSDDTTTYTNSGHWTSILDGVS